MTSLFCIFSYMRFPRGKYKGRLISEVQEYDPGYIRWCKENTPWMLNAVAPKVNKAEQEFTSDFKEQQKLVEYLRNNPATWEEAFGDQIWLPRGEFVYLQGKIEVMIKKFIKKYKKEFDTVAGFLFIAAVFYLLYFTLWVICPC